MPLTPLYLWEEDERSIYVSVKIRGASLKDIDIYVSDLVLKLNFQPYVLLLDLLHEVDEISLCAKRHANEDALKITLTKKNPAIWGSLLCHEEKQSLKKRRQDSMERKAQLETAMESQRKEKRQAYEKKTLRAQMALDDANRQILDDLKAEEKVLEEEKLYEVISMLEADKHKLLSNSHPSLLKERDEAVIACDMLKAGANGTSNLEVDILDEKSSVTSRESSSVASSKFNAKQEALLNHEIFHIPPPRCSAKSKIQFTPRVFPTPSRESKAAEEEDWLLKNRKHLRTHTGLASGSSYDISETDPMWLKAKGDDFYRAQDYKSAINAYSEAINHDPSISCYSNRAACYLQLSKYESCTADCTKALCLIADTPEELKRDSDESQLVYLQNFRFKHKLLIRRGTALCRLGRYTEAKADYGLALSLDQQNCDLQTDYAELVKLEQCQTLKEAGDDALKRRDFEEALQRYDRSLSLNPSFIPSLSNRATCYLLMNELKSCVQDCTSVLELLQVNTQKNDVSLSFSNTPAAGTTERRAWVLKTLIRRGTAYVHLKQWEEANADFTDGLTLDPDNESLKKDLQEVQQEIQPYRLAERW